MDKTDAKVLLEHAKLARMAYDDTAVATDFLSQDNVIKVRYKADIAYIVKGYKGGILIIIRGTDSLKDMLSNLKFRYFNFFKKGKKVNPNQVYISSNVGKVHRGFYEAAKGLLMYLEPHLVGCKRENIRFSAHSRGGPLALLIGLRLSLKGYSVKELYSFNGPRCFAGKQQIPFYHNRFYMENERVHNLPPKILGYRHDIFGIVGKSPWWSKYLPIGVDQHSIKTCIEYLDSKA
jgi:predicted lipase